MIVAKRNLLFPDENIGIPNVPRVGLLSCGKLPFELAQENQKKKRFAYFPKESAAKNRS